MIAGAVLHRNPWKLHVHGAGTHTVGFALTSGMLAGFGGLVSAGSAEGERDLIVDTLAGAVLVGSHIVLDALPLPYLKIRKGAPAREAIRKSAFNWTLDAVVYGAIAAWSWRSRRIAQSEMRSCTAARSDVAAHAGCSIPVGHRLDRWLARTRLRWA